MQKVKTKNKTTIGMKRIHYIFLVGIILAALFFRFYKITEMPGGLFPDEAANGLDITLMQQGHLQPFYERGNGREALFFYWLWASISIFGKGPWQHHIVSALTGVLAVLGCFLLTYKLFSLFSAEDKRKRAIWIALLAAFLMAVSSWHTVVSRTAFRANLLPLFSSYTLYFLLIAWSAKTRLKQFFFAWVSGAVFALGFYSYIASRMMVPILGLLILWPLGVSMLERKRFQIIQKYWKSLLFFIEGFIICIFPLAVYFWTHPGSFVGRSGQVSIFNPELNGGHLIGTFLEVLKESLLGYITAGDLNWRHNISGFPFLSPIISPFFVIGLTLITILAARYAFRPRSHRSDWKFFLVAGLFWGMLVPVVTTAEGIPHGLRSIGTIPAVFIITSWCLYTLYAETKERITAWCKPKSFKLRLLKLSSWVLVICFSAALIIQTYSLYFIYAYNSPENFYSFRSDLTTVSQWLNQFASRQHTYLVLDKFSLQTPEYLTTIDAAHPDNPRNTPYAQVDPEDSWQSAQAQRDGKPIWQHGLSTGDQIVFTQSSIFDIKKFKAYHPEAKLTYSKQNKFGQWVLAVYTIQ